MSRQAALNDIIIADNDYIIRGILRSMLEGEGFTVLQAIDGLEAVAYAARTQACLVILDYKMPKMDGFAACAQIRRLPGYEMVPIVILTAFDDDQTRATASDAGATTFLAKPFRPVDLLHAITTVLGLSARDPGTELPGAGSASLVWQRHREPSPIYGEPRELSEGRRVLNICRR